MRSLFALLLVSAVFIGSTGLNAYLLVQNRRLAEDVIMLSQGMDTYRQAAEFWHYKCQCAEAFLKQLGYEMRRAENRQRDLINGA